ncbi:MAG: ribosome silencing factor [Clostridia bacterium]|nr:ribosome silencing factor [Clostridia bacterium]
MAETKKDTTAENVIPEQESEAAKLAVRIVKLADSRFAGDIKLLHVTSRTVIADYFVICTGNSSTQVRSICDEVEFRLSEDGITPARTEGLDGPLNWAVMDYSSVILHVFNSETRNFYGLERLWSEAEEVDVTPYITAK